MHTDPRHIPALPLLVSLLALLLLALVTALGGWIAGGVVGVLGLLLLSSALGRRRERPRVRGGGDGGASLHSWGGDSGCDSDGGSSGDGGGCGGE